VFGEGVKRGQGRGFVAAGAGRRVGLVLGLTGISLELRLPGNGDRLAVDRLLAILRLKRLPIWRLLSILRLTIGLCLRLRTRTRIRPRHLGIQPRTRYGLSIRSWRRLQSLLTRDRKRSRLSVGGRRRLRGVLPQLRTRRRLILPRLRRRRRLILPWLWRRSLVLAWSGLVTVVGRLRRLLIAVGSCCCRSRS